MAKLSVGIKKQETLLKNMDVIKKAIEFNGGKISEDKLRDFVEKLEHAVDTVFANKLYADFSLIKEDEIFQEVGERSIDTMFGVVLTTAGKKVLWLYVPEIAKAIQARKEAEELKRIKNGNLERLESNIKYEKLTEVPAAAKLLVSELTVAFDIIRLDSCKERVEGLLNYEGAVRYPEDAGVEVFAVGFKKYDRNDGQLKMQLTIYTPGIDYKFKLVASICDRIKLSPQLISMIPEEELRVIKEKAYGKPLMAYMVKEGISPKLDKVMKNLAKVAKKVVSEIDFSKGYYTAGELFVDAMEYASKMERLPPYKVTTDLLQGEVDLTKNLEGQVVGDIDDEMPAACLARWSVNVYIPLKAIKK